jgi:hypothetical protein
MTTLALRRNGLTGTRVSRTPTRELAWSLGASVGLTAVILGVGLVLETCLCSTAAVCWSLVGAGILGTHLTSRGVPWGWLLMVSLQPMWIVYALTTDQYGFILGSIACGLAQLNGFLRARRAPSAPAPTAPPRC